MKLFEKLKPNNEFEQVVAELKRLTEMDSIALSFKAYDGVSPAKSKLGGAPFLKSDEEYPIDSKGNKMLFLAQICLNDIPAFSENGMLRFFVSGDGSCEGKALYCENFSGEAADVTTVKSVSFSPVLRECEIEFSKSKDYICVNDNSFNACLSEAVKTVCSKDMQGDMYDFFSEEECEALCREFTAKGSKLFGNPCFTQCDVRDEESDEILLFQLDSDGESIMWGDWGVGSFFIKKDDLKNLNFKNVLFSWDCG